MILDYKPIFYNTLMDTLLYCISEDLYEANSKIQNDLNKITIWLNQKDIFINKEKTISIVFENPMTTRFRRRNETVLKIHENKYIDDKRNNMLCNCNIIKQETSIKYLGVRLDKNMKLKTQTQYIRNKLNSVMYQMKHIKKVLPLTTKCMIYKTLCESILRYAIESYGYTSEENLKRIKSMHKRILKATLYPFTTKETREEKMKFYRILNFQNLHKFVMISKHYYEDIHRIIYENPYNTRNTQYITPNTRNNYGKTTIKFQVPSLLNSLPNELKNIDNKNKMKLDLQKHLLETRNTMKFVKKLNKPYYYY
jgi:hypothetical protein